MIVRHTVNFKCKKPDGTEFVFDIIQETRIRYTAEQIRYKYNSEEERTIIHKLALLPDCDVPGDIEDVKADLRKQFETLGYDVMITE